MKSPREHMEIVNAYELVGSYRGAAVICGTGWFDETFRQLDSRAPGHP